MTQAFNPSFLEVDAGDLCDFEARLVYRVSVQDRQPGLRRETLSLTKLIYI